MRGGPWEQPGRKRARCETYTRQVPHQACEGAPRLSQQRSGRHNHVVELNLTHVSGVQGELVQHTGATEAPSGSGHEEQGQRFVAWRVAASGARDDDDEVSNRACERNDVACSEWGP